MKALTLTQPWATLVAHGIKLIETRSWSTNYRGRLAIHAAKGFPQAAQELCFSEPFRMFLSMTGYIELNKTYLGNHNFPLGCVIATCRLMEVVKIENKPILYYESFFIPPGEPELSFGDFSPGRYAWILEDIDHFPNPIPAKGSLGLWEWKS